MRCERQFLLPGGGIPQTNGFIPTPTGECRTIRAEGYAIDMPRMRCERQFLLPGGSIPQMNNVSATGDSSAITGDSSAIWTEGYATDPIRMSSCQ